MKKWVIARPINGISINGDEYGVNKDGIFDIMRTRESDDE